MDIKNNEIHLWYLLDEEITDSRILLNYEKFLSNSELENMNNFHQKQQQKQYLLTRVFLRSVLSQYIKNILPIDWVFSKNSYGKPFISNKPLSKSIKFNLSHTEKLIVLAIVLDNEIGVDTEYTLKNFEYLDIAKIYFSENELIYLLNSPDDKQKNCFFDIWTLKEAFVKATGKGLTFPLNQFSLELPRENNIGVLISEENNIKSEAWQFWKTNINNTHKISIAINKIHKVPEYNITMREFTPTL